MSADPAIAAGWYQDPHDARMLRWWDGSSGTEHVAAEPEQQRVSSAEDAAAPYGLDAGGRWVIPPPTSPVWPREDRAGSVHASMSAAYHAQLLARLPILVGATLASVLLGLIALPVLLVTDELLWRAVNVVRSAVFPARLRARSIVWAHALRARGFEVEQVEEPTRVASESADKERVDRHRWQATGVVAGFPATFGEWIDITERAGDTTTFDARLFATFELPPKCADRHREVRVDERGETIWSRWEGGRDVEFESVEVDRALRIRVDRRVDGVAVRELIGPQLLAALAERPVCWHQVGRQLTVSRRSPAEPAAELDAFMQVAVAVARAYWSDQD